MPQAVAPAPSFSTRTPDVLNSAGRLSFSLPVLNTGAGLANNLIITDITLSAAARVGPALPLSLGDLAVDNVILVNANFLNDGLVVGSRYLVTVRGTYESGGVLYGFALNRYIVVPDPSQFERRLFQERNIEVIPIDGRGRTQAIAELLNDIRS